MNDIVDFLIKTRRLSQIERCSNTPHIKQYNVAEHSFYICLYTMIFADLENKRLLEEQESPQLYDTKKAIQKALIHDLEESITGDILYPIKRENAKLEPVLDAVINDCVKEELFSELPNSLKNAYISLWMDSKDESIEGQLVAAMDKFELMVYGLFELQIGNYAFKPIFDTAIKILRNHYKQIISLQKTINAIEVSTIFA